MWEFEKTRAATAVARVLWDYASSERLMQLWSKLQHVRTVLDEAQGAFWHFGAIPSRRDVRLILRRVSSLRRRVAELDRSLARIERSARDERRRENGAATSRPL
jgi:hypothetical protein